jgi:xylulokinase
MIFLGIDSGTQSTKTIALDATTGDVLAQASAAHGLIEGLSSGHAEQHPRQWTDAVDQTIETVLDQLGVRKSEIKGIGVSGQQHGFVPLDANDQVIRPAKLWCDTSTVAECDQIRAVFGGRTGVIAAIGNDILPGFTAPKILWLKNHEPANFAKLTTILLPHDYLNFHLTGRKSMEYGDASGTALLDVRSRTWSKEICNAIDAKVLGCLPPLQSSKKAAGTLRPELAQRWGLGADVVISAGGGDNMMGAIGTGNLQSGCVTASLGTSGTIYACASQPVIDPEGEIAAFCDSTDLWLPLLCTMNVTVATEQVRNLFEWDHVRLSSEIEATPAGSDGLLFLPYLQGERTPNLPQATGVLHGLTTRNYKPGHLARATMEGVTLGLAYGLQRLTELGVKASQIRLTGGGSKSAVWRQICADVFGCEIVTLQNAEGAALGGALQALALVDTSKTLEQWASALLKLNNTETTRPDPVRHALYVELLKKHTKLTRDLAAAGQL